MNKSINYTVYDDNERRKEALNDATGGRIGKEPRSVPEEGNSDLKNERMKTARKMSRDM